jgi:hypothetical protein
LSVIGVSKLSAIDVRSELRSLWGAFELTGVAELSVIGVSKLSAIDVTSELRSLWGAFELTGVAELSAEYI